MGRFTVPKTIVGKKDEKNGLGRIDCLGGKICRRFYESFKLSVCSLQNGWLVRVEVLRSFTSPVVCFVVISPIYLSQGFQEEDNSTITSPTLNKKFIIQAVIYSKKLVAVEDSLGRMDRNLSLDWALPTSLVACLCCLKRVARILAGDLRGRLPQVLNY